GDHLLVIKFSYGIRNPINGALWIPVDKPERKDIIVFEYPVEPSKDFIKRVIGLPGDRIKIIDKKVFVNGKRFKVEAAVHRDSRIIPGELSPRDNYGPVTVPEKSLFVMGDNRDNSHDSRFWGFVDFRKVKGKAVILYWSWDSEEFSPRWSRIGDIIN
ncbi:MAG: signal peptidase I, partial [Thermodesulfobacteriota bacterium]